MKRFALWILLPILATITILAVIGSIVGVPAASHPATHSSSAPKPSPSRSTDECRTEPNDPPNWPACTDQLERPTFATDANTDILALCATNGTPCEAWMRSHRDIPIHTYGKIGSTLNGGVIRYGNATELDDDGFELWGQPGHFHGAVS